MRASEYKKIRDVYDTLVRELELQDNFIIDYLFRKEVLTREDKESLNSLPTSLEKNRRLLDMLETKEDAAYGIFREAVVENQPHLAECLKLPGVQRRTARSRQTDCGKAFEDFTVEDLKQWLQPRLSKERIPETVLEQIRSKDIDGKTFLNMTNEEFKEQFEDLNFGPRKRLQLIRDEVKESSSPAVGETRSALPLHQEKEHARQFAQTPRATEKYYERRILNVHEAALDSSMLSPIRQFFPCTDDHEREDLYAFIAKKVVMFSAACLNGRKNGTIYFGVGNKDCDLYRHREVLGVPLDKKECEDEIRQTVSNSFPTDVVEIVLKCLQTFFMEVVHADKEVSHFVCEVDIQPQSDLVGDRTFFHNVSDTTLSGKKQILYQFENGIPTEQTPDQTMKFGDRKRKLFEQRQQEEKQAPCPRPKNLPQLLKNFLCGGTDQLDGSFCHLLAVGRVDASATDMKQSFEFVAEMDWRGILDFDPQSGEKGLYKYLDEQKQMLYRVKMAEDFDALKPEISKQATADQDMDEPELKPWIFCNGHEDIGEKGHDIIEWKKERRPAFRKTVEHFVTGIPDKRAVIVILLTSKDDIFMEASEELLLRFPDQWVMIAESELLANEWINSLQQRNIEVDQRRCLYSLAFPDINKAVLQLMSGREVPDEGCFVTSSSGLQVEICKKDIQRLGDLDILSTNMCSNCPENSSELRAIQEESFYRCNEATWWNFYFPGQVHPREKLEELKTKARAVLDGDPEESNIVGSVCVYHQPGAGGTTIAMNVLWDLHKDFKCCRLKRITSDTPRQILSLHELGETAYPSQRRKPVLVMIDIADDDQVNELKRHVEEECFNKQAEKLVCVFLVCTRCFSLPKNHHEHNVFLQQKLTERERLFFVDKYSELQEKGKVPMAHLLGLNIMKENFNVDYIKRTVASFVKRYSGHEQSVLRYVALLNGYDLLARPIPVSCFDQEMSHTGKGGQWESKFVPDPLVTFTTNSRLPGRNKCLRVTNQLLCPYILDDIAEQRSQSHEEMMREFLSSKVFQTRSYDFATRLLLNIVKDCMKKRGTDPTGTRKSKFSRFIQMLIDAGNYDDAVQCIDTVFERTDDAFLAQQIARIYIHHKMWNEADDWARKAVEGQPNNSFVLDTQGQILKSRLSEVLEESERKDKDVDDIVAVDAVKCAHRGFTVFKRVQYLNGKEGNDPPNTSGWFGQMDIVTMLFRILKFHPEFPSKTCLQMFLSGNESVQVSFASHLHSEDVKWLRSLENEAFNCLKEVEDQQTMYSTSSTGFVDVRAQFFLSEDNVSRFEEKLNDIFGEEDQAARNPQKLTAEKRQRLMTKLGGKSLYSVMTQCGFGEEGRAKAEEIWQLASHSLKGNDGKGKQLSRNLSMALASALTLIGCHGVEFTEDDGAILKWSADLFLMTERPGRDKFINIDPYIYLLLFHWPAPDQHYVKDQCESTDLKKAAGLAKEAFEILKGRKFRRNNPIFFLTRKPGVDKVISKSRLQRLCEKPNEKWVNKLLSFPKVSETLEQFNGILMNNGVNVKMKLKTRQGKETDMLIPLFIRENDQSLWNKKVSFVLGVGTGGPVACAVKLDTPDPSQLPQAAGRSGPKFPPEPVEQTRQKADQRKGNKKFQQR